MEKIRVTGAFACIMIMEMGGGSGEGELIATWKYPDQKFLDPRVQEAADKIRFFEDSIFYLDEGIGEIRWVHSDDYEVIS